MNTSSRYWFENRLGFFAERKPYKKSAERVVLMAFFWGIATVGVIVARADTFTVRNTEDDGNGSLRQAIISANAHDGPDLIAFAIPSTDPNFQDVDNDGQKEVFIIRLLSELPALQDDSTVIDGRTQQNSTTGDSNPLGPEIRIEGLEWPNTGLRIASSHNRVFALNIDACGSSAIWIAGAGNWIAGCYLGTDPTGARVVKGNESSGITISYGRANHNIIGTNGDGIDDASEGNVIAGNGIGIDVSGIPWLGPKLDPGRDYSGRPKGNRIAGNLIGGDRTGRVALGNGWHGVMLNGATETLVGADGDGMSDELERNIISASTDSDVMIRNQQWEASDRGGDYNNILGNYIGTDITGKIALRRSGEPVCWGVTIMMGSKGNRVERNLISGHTPWRDPGVAILDDGTDENVIRDNFIGTDSSGRQALGNGWLGVWIAWGARFNRIEGNVISGNQGAGLNIDGGMVEPNLRQSANNHVLGNLIGTDVSGQNPLPNAGPGVTIWSSAENLVEGNQITDNQAAGIVVGGAGAVGNALHGNTAYNNGGLGIDLTLGSWDGDGVTANDSGDLDAGPNALQNFPVLDERSVWSPGRVVIHGQLDSRSNTEFVLEFFANADADPSGHGEGRQFLGSTIVRTESGPCQFVARFAVFDLVGPDLTATATDPAGNTSEFGPALRVRAVGAAGGE